MPLHINKYQKDAEDEGMHIHLVREDASLPFVLSKTHDTFVQKLNTYKGTSDMYVAITGYYNRPSFW